jgi:rhodanese-related sulfurtransferase
VPSVTAPALNEWPAPATRTGPGPSATARASSPRVRGASKRDGRARWDPDQLTHSTTADATVRAMDVDAERVAELQREGTIQLIDVREDHEWDAGRIPGARHVELGELAAQAATIPRDAAVVFYCRVGGRSAMAASAFRRAGYDAYNLIGGLEEWAARGLPLEPQDGHVAEH